MYDALIIVNGEIAQTPLWQDLAYHTLMCTDGAALALLKMNLVPNIILGDMDSVGAHTPLAGIALLQNNFPNTKILLIQDQDTTDFEKALLHAQHEKYQRVLCLGALGKAADHSLYNILLLSRFGKKMDLIFLHQIENEAQWIFLLKDKMKIQADLNSAISFWPMSQALLSTQGLKWELQNTHLTQSEFVSIRNRTTLKQIEIKCQGVCLCFLTTPLPPVIHI